MRLKQRGSYEDQNQEQARALIQPGVTLYGYCGGVFGRDSYGDKVVDFVSSDGVIYAQETRWGGVGSTPVASRVITDWAALVESSNGSLSTEEGEE